MAPTIVSSVLFNLNTNQTTFSDNVNYSTYAISLANVDGNLRCTGSISGIFYNNMGEWSTPSIDLSATNTKVITLPTSGGIVIAQNYTFEYIIRVLTSVTPSGGTIHDPGQPEGFIVEGGDYTSQFTVGATFTVTGGPNAGVYSVLNPVYDSGTNSTYIYVDQDIPVDSTEGTITIYTEYSQTQTFTFSDCAPVVVLELTDDCDCNSITSQDLTNYTVNIGGNYYAPTTIARVHTVNPPISPSTGTQVAGSTVSSNATIIVSPIATTVWTSTVVTTLTYNIDGLIVQKTASGSARVDVVCSDALCCAYGCLRNIVTTYEEFKNNLARKEEWQTILIRALGWWMVYSVARSCGQTATAEEALTNLLDIAKKAGCSCCNDNSAEPVWVIGLCNAGGTSGSGASVVVAPGTGISVTPNSVGNTITYTVALDLGVLYGYIATYLAANPLDLNDLSDVVLTSPGSGALLRFNGVNWVNVNSIPFNQITEVLITGSSLAVGDVLKWNGSKWVNGTNTGNIIEIATTTYTSVGTPTQTLKSVNLPVGTFADNGDFIHVDSQWIVSNDTNLKTVIFAIGGLDFALGTAFLSYINVGQVFYGFDIIRVSSTTVRIRKWYQTYGNVSGTSYPELTPKIYYADPLTYPVNNMDTLANTLAFRCNPTAGSSVITLNDYTVTSFKG
jgi:hypothetical protein